MALLRKPKTYETITAGLRNMLDELGAYVEEQTAQAANQRRLAEQMLANADASEAEAAKAQFTAEKLAGLLGG